MQDQVDSGPLLHLYGPFHYSVISCINSILAIFNVCFKSQFLWALQEAENADKRKNKPEPGSETVNTKTHVSQNSEPSLAPQPQPATEQLNSEFAPIVGASIAPETTTTEAPTETAKVEIVATSQVENGSKAELLVVQVEVVVPEQPASSTAVQKEIQVHHTEPSPIHHESTHEEHSNKDQIIVEVSHNPVEHTPTEQPTTIETEKPVEPAKTEAPTTSIEEKRESHESVQPAYQETPVNVHHDEVPVHQEVSESHEVTPTPTHQEGVGATQTPAHQEVHEDTHAPTQETPVYHVEITAQQEVPVNHEPTQETTVHHEETQTPIHQGIPVHHDSTQTTVPVVAPSSATFSWKDFFLRGFDEPSSTQYEKIFLDNELDASHVPELDHDLLKSMGFNVAKVRLIILKLKQSYSVDKNVL